MPAGGSAVRARLLPVAVAGALLLLAASPPPVRPGFACLSSPCVHGVCLDDLNSSYFCYCIDGYTGVQCQTNWNECWSSPCQNGGLCVDGIAMFNCSCPPGFVGDLCEEDFNECESNPCLNNGTCTDVINGYNCNCLPGYSGEHCEIDVAVCNTTNETRCSNGGVCQEGPGETFSCKCQSGWGGFLCENEIDECMSAPCQNGAICIDLHADYACACLFGYTGRNCEEIVHICNENPCKNGALCLIEEKKYTCYCVPDFHGDLCQYQYDECQLGPRCLNGGTCIDGIDNATCSCPPNLTGVRCECLILENTELDCTYIAPSTTTLKSPDLTTYPATDLTTVTVLTTLGTTLEVPNITTDVISTDYLFNTTVDTIITTFTPKTSPETETTITSTTPQEFTTTEIMTTSVKTTTPEESTITTDALFTTTQKTKTDTEYSTYPTTITPLYTDVSIFSTITEKTYTTFYPSTTELTDETTPITTVTTDQTTGTITLEFTTPPTISFPTSPETTTSSETNRSFPEVLTTLQPSVTTFLTEEPTELTTLMETTLTTLTTMSPTETTMDTVDCTIAENHCQNGGTCVYTGKTHKCLCPFDTEGSYCEKKLGVRRAAFNGESFLSHRLLNLSNIIIEFEAKTLSNSGLLFYSNIDTSYMALYIQDGYLRFKFSCGYQTMLLSELKVPVNNGNLMNIKAMLEFSNNFKHCDASIKVNNSISMAGDQIGQVDKFLNPIAWLHLGGIPQQFLNENVPIGGFVGCIMDLKISNKKIHIYEGAENGYEVSECSSLACLSNPCKNGASCTPIGEEWSCHCRNGYLGKMCEISVCDNNPCMFGGTCIPFSSSGYICLCPYGKHGHFCENDLKITEPYFSSTIRGLSSYVAYQLPFGISSGMEIQFRFIPTTMEQISILLFVGQAGYHDNYSDHLAVSFVKGYIMLTWNLGSGPRRIFTAQPIKKGARDYLIRLGYFGRRAWLYVENIGNITGRSPGNLAQLDVVPLLYLGGHESKNFSGLPHDLPLHTGFSGCIFDLQIKSGPVILPLEGSRNTFGRAVGQCGTTECYEQSCQNRGACLHHGSTFMCLCQDNWYGPLCLSQYNLCEYNHTKCHEESRCVPLLSDYECDCPFGRTGKYCSKEENISDVSFTGKRSYISLHPIEMDNIKFNIEFELRTLGDHGIILFIGKSTSFVCLSMQDDVLELKIHPNKGKMVANDPLSIRSSKLLTKGIWYKIQFGIFGRKAYLSVDNTINTGVLNQGHFLSISQENIFLGGVPDMSLLPTAATSSLPVPYTGCIRRITVDERDIVLVKENIQNSRNVVDCDGTPCGGETCLNGGTCWLDSFMQPHCSCVHPYYGEKCEKVPDCNENSCRNNGKCNNSQCTCQVGYDGAFCEVQLEVKTPAFTGTSYLIVSRPAEKKRNINDVELKKLYMNFTTADKDGMLLWSKKGKNFVGLGIEKGFLKVAFSQNKARHQVEIPSFFQVSDGLWHAVEIDLLNLILKIDGKLFQIAAQPDKLRFPENTTIATDGLFFLGGIPSQNLSLLTETNGLFPYAFKGCIQGFGANTETVITDFSRYDGTNIDVCRVI